MNKEQSKIILDALVQVPRLQSTCEFIVSVVTENWPEVGLKYLEGRRNLSRDKNKPELYDAIPYKPPYLGAALSKAPKPLFKHLWKWFKESPSIFQFEGATLLESAFQGYPDVARKHLESWIERDVEFVIACLHGFEGIEAIYPTVKKIVEHLPTQSPLLRAVDLALDSSGTVYGDFGFRDLYSLRIDLLSTWLNDPSPKIQAFAKHRAENLKKSVIAETRRVEAEIAALKLEFGESLGDDNAPP